MTSIQLLYNSDNLYDDDAIEQFNITELFEFTFFNTSICLTAELIHYCKTYEDKQYEDMKNYFNEYIRRYTDSSPEGDDSINVGLLNVMLDIFTRDNHEEYYPSIEQIVDELFAYRCNCTYYLHETTVKEMIKAYVTERYGIPKCEEYPIMASYYTLHKRLPTVADTEEFIRRNYEFTVNPEDYYQQDKVKVPTTCIDELPRRSIRATDVQQELCCSLCQSDFEEGQKAIVIKPCNHYFHCESKDCLDTSCIINWLQENNNCPMCKTKIQLV